MSTPTQASTNDKVTDPNTVVINGQRLACTRKPGVLTFFMELTHENRCLEINLPSDVPVESVQILIEPLSSSIT